MSRCFQRCVLCRIWLLSEDYFDHVIVCAVSAERLAATPETTLRKDPQPPQSPTAAPVEFYEGRDMTTHHGKK